MKPVIIYTLPRTRSTATLFACKRDHKFNEPFSYIELVLFPSRGRGDFRRKISKEWWDNFHPQLDQPQAVSKIFGSNLCTCAYAREWFKSADENRTHEIFVLTRDLREVCYSFLVALLFGFNKETEVEPTDLEIKEHHLFNLFFELDNFFRFFPKNGTLITFDDLPEEFFDKSIITTESEKVLHDLHEQNSLEKISRLQNFDYASSRVDELLAMFEMEACQSGLSSRFAKPRILERGSVGSNPTASST